MRQRVRGCVFAVVAVVIAPLLALPLDVESPNDVAVISLPMNVRLGTDGGGFVSGSSNVSSVVFVAAVAAFASALDARIAAFLPSGLQLCDECRRILIVDADGGASMNLFVIGSAVLFRNSKSEAFGGMPKLAARVDRLQ